MLVGESLDGQPQRCAPPSSCRHISIWTAISDPGGWHSPDHYNLNNAGQLQGVPAAWLATVDRASGRDGYAGLPDGMA